MKIKLWMALVLITMASCTTGYQATPAAEGDGPANVIAVSTERPAATATPSIVPTATINPFLDIYVSETAVELARIQLAQQAEQLRADQAYQDLQLTSDSATSTAGAAITQTKRADDELAIARTAGVPGTQIAGSATSAAVTATAKIEEQQYRSKVAGIWIWKAFLLILALAVLGGVIYGGILLFRSLHFQMSQMAPDENGRFKLVAESAIPGDSKRLINPNLAHRVSISAKDDDLTAEQALQNTAHARQLEGIRALVSSPTMKRQLTKPANPISAPTSLPASDAPLLLEYPLPEWTTWMQNWKPGFLALGINEKGLLQADPERNPHFLYAGTTGSWKTRGGVRVLVACALANGWQVIIAGKKLDYQVFESHANAHLVPFSLLHEPTRAVDLLRSVYSEIERRDRMMSDGGHSLWSHTGNTRTVVVVDEFSNLADALEDIDKAKREELWRWARMDTAEARKYGIHMVYALQDPTARSIDLRIRRNTTPIVFRVKDADSSRTILNSSGAEMLPERHFLTSMIKLERGAAFAPTDQDLVEFLEAHPVQAVEPQAWIEGTVVGEEQSTISGKRAGDIDGQIVDLYVAMKANNKVSLSEIQRQVYGDVNTGGAHFRHIQDVIAKVASDATTTENMPNSGILGSSATGSAA